MKCKLCLNPIPSYRVWKEVKICLKCERKLLDHDSIRINGSKKPLLGIELEVCCKNRFHRVKTAYWVRKHKGFTCYNDGGGRYPLELNCNPGTLREMKKKWKPILISLRRRRCWSHKNDDHNSGLHIHINESYLQGKAAKLAYFTSSIKKVLVLLGRRHRYNYFSWSTPKYRRYSELVDIDTDTVSHGRGLPTIELRFFKGTLNWKNFFVSLETAHALMSFIRFVDCDVNSPQKSLKQFFTFIRKYPKRYKYLIKNLEIIQADKIRVAKSLPERKRISKYWERKIISIQRKEIGKYV